MNTINKEEKRYLRAKKQVEEIKGFYANLVVYILVVLFVSPSSIIYEFDVMLPFDVEYLDMATLFIWFFWGIGILVQGLKVFGINALLGNQWEEHKIEEFFNKSQNETN